MLGFSPSRRLFFRLRPLGDSIDLIAPEDSSRAGISSVRAKGRGKPRPHVSWESLFSLRILVWNAVCAQTPFIDPSMLFSQGIIKKCFKPLETQKKGQQSAERLMLLAHSREAQRLFRSLTVIH